jgi:hypothetical protein
MADESQIDPTNQKVGVLLSYGVPEEDIVARLSQSDDPEHQNWVRQYKAQQVEKESKAKLGLTQSAVQSNQDAIAKQAELINQQGDVGVSPGKLAQIGIVGKVGYELGKQIPAAAEYGSKLFGTLKDKMAVPSTVEAPPVAETAPSGVAKLQERFNLVPKKESTPEETRQQRLKAAAATAQGEMANVVPGAAVPGAVAPTAATPSAVEAVTPAVDAAITADPVATPVEKAQAHVNAPEVAPEAPAAVNRYDVTTPVDGVTNAPAETPAPEAKVKGAVAPRAERGSLPTIAHNPLPIEGQPGMREQYNVPKGIDPSTGKPWIGKGGFTYILGQYGPEKAPPVWEEQYGKRNVPYSQVVEDFSSARHPPTSVTVEGKSGGTFPTKGALIPDYIRGAATPQALATTAVLAALPALGVAAVQKYKGNKAAVDASLQDAKESLQSLATMPYDVSKAALKGDFGPLKDLMLSINPGSLLFNEMNKHDEEIIKKMIYKEKVGAGRGMQGVPPPSNR